MSIEALQALEAAGAGNLPAPAQTWIGARLRSYGYSPEAMNLGGLLCTLPHNHSAGGCIAVSVGGASRHFAAFPSWDQAATTLVAIAQRAAATPGAPAPDLPQVGFASTHPRADELGGAIDQAVAQSVLGPILGPLAALTTLANAPSAEAEAAFRALLADWESFERAGVPAKVSELRDTHDTWVKFRDSWVQGNPDVLALNAMISDANRVRLTLAEKAGKPPPPLQKNIDADEVTRTLSAANWVDGRVKSLAKEIGVPDKLGLPLAALAVVGVGVGLLYLIVPLMPLLAGGFGGRTSVVVVEPGRRAKR
jgi:hypothetical protein